MILPATFVVSLPQGFYVFWFPRSRLLSLARILNTNKCVFGECAMPLRAVRDAGVRVRRRGWAQPPRRRRGSAPVRSGRWWWRWWCAAGCLPASLPGSSLGRWMAEQPDSSMPYIEAALHLANPCLPPTGTCVCLTALQLDLFFSLMIVSHLLIWNCWVSFLSFILCIAKNLCCRPDVLFAAIHFLIQLPSFWLNNFNIP